MHGGLILQGFLASESQSSKDSSFSQQIIRRKSRGTVEGSEDAAEEEETGG